MPGKHWPAEVKRRAFKLYLEGMSRGDIAAVITLETGRHCGEKSVANWLKGELRVASSPWPARWRRRVRELRLQGVSYENIAHIISLEAARKCGHMTVYEWLNPEWAKKRSRERIAQRQQKKKAA